MAIFTDPLRESYRHGSSPLKPSDLAKPHNAYLFGYPIAHSMAPLLHTSIWKGLQVPWTYSLVESLDKADFLPRLKSSSSVGAAVTMPHKVSIMSELDELTEEASMIGAVNTIFIRENEQGQSRYIGTNTDCIGIRETFVQNFPGIGQEARGRSALVIGGGGACRSALYALWKFFGIKEIYMVNRLDQEVESIISSMGAAGFPGKLTHVKTVEQAKLCEAPIMMVGTIPDLPAKTPEEKLAKRITEEFLKKEQKGYVLDMCYHPSPLTSFMKQSSELGWKVVSGIEMLIHQGIAQDVLWLEKPMKELPAAEAASAVRNALHKTAKR